MAEHPAVNRRVVGSSPTSGAFKWRDTEKFRCPFLLVPIIQNGELFNKFPRQRPGDHLVKNMRKMCCRRGRKLLKIQANLFLILR